MISRPTQVPRKDEPVPHKDPERAAQAGRYGGTRNTGKQQEARRVNLAHANQARTATTDLRAGYVQKLAAQGHTDHEIRETLALSKTTVWRLKNREL